MSKFYLVEFAVEQNINDSLQELFPYKSKEFLEKVLKEAKSVLFTCRLRNTGKKERIDFFEQIQKLT